MKSLLLVALLLVAQGCSARHLLSGFVEPVVTPPLNPTERGIASGARASAEGSDSAVASAGSTADFPTRSTIAGAQSEATGTHAATSAETEGNSMTSSSKTSTSGQAAGSKGAKVTSSAQSTTTPNIATATGFTAGSASGPGSSFQAKTITETTSPFGNSNSKADISIKSEIGLYGSAASSTISGIGGLSSDSRAIGFAREGRFGSAVSTAFTLGGYGGQASTSTDANTVITPTLAASNGDALAKGSYGPRAIVTVTDSARNNVLIKNQGAR